MLRKWLLRKEWSQTSVLLAATKVHWVVTRGNVSCPEQSRQELLLYEGFTGVKCWLGAPLSSFKPLALSFPVLLLCPPYFFIFLQKKSLPCTLNPLDRVLLPFVWKYLWIAGCGNADHMLNNAFPLWKSQLPERSQDGSEVLEP